VKPAVPLIAKILIVATINAAALAMAGVLFVRYELGYDFASVLLAPGRERIQSVSRQMALDLAETPAADREALLDRYRREYGVAFLLVLNDGTRVAGPAMDVPAVVVQRVAGGGRGGPEGRGRGGPPPEFGGPGRGPGPPPNARMPLELVTADGAMPYWVVVRIPIRAKDDPETVPGTLLLASSSLLGTRFYFQPLPWIAIAGVTLLVTTLCWLPLVRGVTRSLADITRATGEIAAGRFDVSLDARRRDEIGVVATSIRSMASRLHALVGGRQRFLRDAAHELRSPVGRMSLAVGLLEREYHDDPRIQRLAADLREEVESMTALTDALLAFARSETAMQAVTLAPTSVHDAVARAVKTEASAADVRVDVDPRLRAVADAELLARAVSNMVRNAVAYAGHAGPIAVRGAREGDDVCVSVADAGPGVPSGDLGLLFSPFYRAEPSRDRRTGGVGLGLAIVRAIAETCRGSASCRNLSPSGFEVTLRLPAA